MASHRIFICYRRDDSAAYADRLSDQLSDRFGADEVFMDLGMPLGVDFVAHLETMVSACSVMLVVIGPAWLTAIGENGTRRLDDDDDYVRFEIVTGFERGVTLIPILVNSAPMPRPRDLPAALAGLARQQAHELTRSRWRQDVERLGDEVKRILAETVKPKVLTAPTRAPSPAPAPSARPQTVFRAAPLLPRLPTAEPLKAPPPATLTPAPVPPRRPTVAQVTSDRRPTSSPRLLTHRSARRAELVRLWLFSVVVLISAAIVVIIGFTA